MAKEKGGIFGKRIVFRLCSDSKTAGREPPAPAPAKNSSASTSTTPAPLPASKNSASSASMTPAPLPPSKTSAAAASTAAPSTPSQNPVASAYTTPGLAPGKNSSASTSRTPAPLPASKNSAATASMTPAPLPPSNNSAAAASTAAPSTPSQNPAASAYTTPARSTLSTDLRPLRPPQNDLSMPPPKNSSTMTPPASSGNKDTIPVTDRDSLPPKFLTRKRRSPHDCLLFNNAIENHFAQQITLGYQEHETEYDSQGWLEDVHENDPKLSLKLLTGKRAYPPPPTKCCFHTHPMTRLDLYLEKRKLTKLIKLPGTSRPCRETTTALMETRVILRRSIRPIYKLHRQGHCLEGSFGLSSFSIDDNQFLTLDYRREDMKLYSKEGAREDLLRFARMVEFDIFRSEDVPDEIERWLLLIHKYGNDCEYLISYDCALMEHNQVLSTYMQLYSKLKSMKISDRIGYQFVLDHLKLLNGWRWYDLHNDYFIETYHGIDIEKRERNLYGKRNTRRKYKRDVISLLRLVRNTFAHITMKRFDQHGNLTFGEDVYEHILNDQFPYLLGEFMEAMYFAGCLADLNLEYCMV